MEITNEKRIVSKQMQAVSRRVGMAVGDYDMLQDGDKVIVAITDKRESLLLLDLLKYRKTFVPITFEILAVYVDPGTPGISSDSLVSYFGKEEIAYHIEKMDLPEQKPRSEWNCFRCSPERVKALVAVAQRLDFNKIAFDYTRDDIAETVLLSLFYGSAIGILNPRQEMSDGKLTTILPLAYVGSQDIVLLDAKNEGIGPGINSCPCHAQANRNLIQKILNQAEKINPTVKGNIVKALRNARKDYLL